MYLKLLRELIKNILLVEVKILTFQLKTHLHTQKGLLDLFLVIFRMTINENYFFYFPKIFLFLEILIYQ